MCVNEYSQHERTDDELHFFPQAVVVFAYAVYRSNLTSIDTLVIQALYHRTEVAAQLNMWFDGMSKC